MRVLGIDPGEARIGLAISDQLGMLAHPLETVPAREPHKPIERIVEVIAEKEIQTLVIGLPLRMDGTEGTAAEKSRKFAAALKKKISEKIEIVFLDERLSTVSAQRQLHDAGRTVKNSRPVIDQAAACVILQDYLDQTNGPEGALLPEPLD